MLLSSRPRVIFSVISSGTHRAESRNLYPVAFLSEITYLYRLELTNDSMKKTYTTPEAELLRSIPLELICTSPEDGGLEDVGYEDWVIIE